MNYIRHLTGFFERVARDDGLNASHISLYVALFQYWNMNRFQNPISIARDDVMQVSKISGKATYHKCMRELHELGYLRYEPSYNPYKGSLVSMVGMEAPPQPSPKGRGLDKESPQTMDIGRQPIQGEIQGVDSSSDIYRESMVDGQYRGDLTPPDSFPIAIGRDLSWEERVTEEESRKGVVVSHKMNAGESGQTTDDGPQPIEEVDNNTRTAIGMGTGTGVEQVLVPSINSINNSNILNNESYRGENSGRQNSGDKYSGSDEKRREKANCNRAEDVKANDKRDTTQPAVEKKKDIPPEISEVMAFFEAEKYPVLEARRFFNHFQSNGWKVGGKAPMKDWHAAARNWMLNFERFNRPVGNKGNIRMGGGKDYGEPL